jgi:hypothetical protein
MSVKVRAFGASAVAIVALSACSYFGGDSKPETTTTASARPVGKLNTECARLQPLFGPDDQDLTRDKLNAALKVELAKWDKDGSGDLSNSETQPLNDELRAENVGASPVTDWNADGRVDEKEFGAGWRTMFELCDRNRNDMVSLRELGHSPNVTAPRAAPSAPKKKPEGASERPPGGGGY